MVVSQSSRPPRHTRKHRDRVGSVQPLVTTGGGALPLPRPAQPATLTATRVASKAARTLVIGYPLLGNGFMSGYVTMKSQHGLVLKSHTKWKTGSQRRTRKRGTGTCARTNRGRSAQLSCTGKRAT